MKRFFACLALPLVFGCICGAQELRIDVLSRYRPKQLEVTPLQTQALIVSVSREKFVLEPDTRNAIATIRTVPGRLSIDIQGQHFVANTFHVTGRTGAAGFLLAVPGEVSRPYFGSLTVVANHGELQAIVTVDLETAVASVVQAETERQTPLEALKAQAVVTRSYFVAAKGRHQRFDFCDLAHCQVMRGRPSPGSPAARAAAATRDLILTYANKPFAAMFTRSCGGGTRTPAEDGLPYSNYPYFSVVCDYCRKNPFRWTRKISAADAALLAKGENGRLALCRRLGWNAIPSNDFTTRKSRDGILLEGEGQGHGIGLCQRGAEAMAQSGANFRAILAHYFPNTSLARLGPTPTVRATRTSRLRGEVWVDLLSQ
jgi:stage II sporulation protein D